MQLERTMNAEQLQKTARDICVIPVIVIDRLEDAVPLANALVEGGLPILEITLRTPVALQAITAIRREVPKAIVGAGTVLDAAQWRAAANAGATFIVSPGFTPALAAVAAASDIPWLPGVSSAGEVMLVRDAGFHFLKFFPAEQSGGMPMLSALGGPFTDIVFCPTGGIDVVKARSYLALANVVCVGGSWVAPKDKITAKDWAGVTRLAREARALRAA
jgi:2-dehydro-3-deoxyphosphogluconate aldolase/(4S)-4-hydroxy-2-oxoglutarate aldolase